MFVTFSCNLWDDGRFWVTVWFEGKGWIADVSHLLQNDLFPLFMFCFEDGKILIVDAGISWSGGGDESRVR